MWADVLLDVQADESRLATAFASAFDAPIGDVCVVRSIEAAPLGVPILVAVRDVAGEFRVLLSVSTCDSYSSSPVVGVVSRVCRTLGGRALIAEESEDPFRMLLVGERREVASVSLDPEALDRDEYRLLT
jgi:hypothetical protein